MLIQFGEINIKLLIPLLFPIFLKFRRLNRRNNDINSQAFTEFCNFLSIIPCIILYFIQKIKSKTRKDDIERDTFNINKVSIGFTELSTRENKKNSKVKQYLFVALISFLQLCASTLKILFYKSINKALKTNIQPLFQLLCLISFCIIFLGFSIYSHQIISVIIICTCLIIFFIETVIYQDITKSDIIKSMLFYLFLQGFYILSNVLGKKYLNKYIENFFLFLFKYCIISLIPMIIYGFLACLINVKDDNYKIFQYFPKIKIWIFLVDLFFSFLYELGLWLTIYFFNPCYYFIFETLADFLELILSKFDKTSIKYTTSQLITFYILYPIILFFISIFFEIIILNFCGLSYNTKIKISERGKRDTKNNEKAAKTTEIKLDLSDNDSEGGYYTNL